MPFEAPISRWQEPVQEAWVDYNGHLNVAYYTLIFDNAVEKYGDDPSSNHSSPGEN